MIIRDGYSFILAAIVIAVLLGITLNPWWAIGPVVLALYFAFSFVIRTAAYQKTSRF